MNLRKAAEMALNYFESAYELDSHEIEIRDALRKALAQPEQRGHCTCGDPEALGVVHFRTRPCFHYIHQPKREWVELTDEEAWGVYRTHGLSFHRPNHVEEYEWSLCMRDFAKAIEAKLKEKNYG